MIPPRVSVDAVRERIGAYADKEQSADKGLSSREGAPGIARHGRWIGMSRAMLGVPVQADGCESNTSPAHTSVLEKEFTAGEERPVEVLGDLALLFGRSVAQECLELLQLSG